jgi:hypothetical protein
MAMGVVALVALVAVQLVATYSLLVGAGRSSTHVLQPDVAGTPESMDWHEKGGVKEEQVGSWPGSFSFFASLHTSLSLSLSLSPLELDSSSWVPTLSEAGSSSSPVLQGDFVS